jgi:hypothetical protein
MALRDRLLTARVARAMTSPSALALAAAAAGVALLADAPLVAPVAAVGAWAARVALAVPRRERRERLDPFTLSEPWRFYVRDAMQAAARYERAVAGARSGPLRERLEEIGRRIDEAVQECWRVAKRGHALEDGVKAMDLPRTQRKLEAAEADRDPTAAGSLDDAIRSMRSQVESAERLRRVAQDAKDRLRLLDARLEEAVSRALELSLQAESDTALSGLGADVDAVVLDLEALRLAIEETSGPAAPS